MIQLVENDMEDPHGRREMNKFGLDSYLEDYEFPNLEIFLKDAIDALLEQLKKVSKEYDEAKVRDPDEDYSDVHFYMHQIFSIQDRLLSVYEMIIINDYKEFELILKRLLKASLDFDEKDFRSFDDSKYILKGKGIKFSEINNYNDINHLRKLNNHIKHTKINKVPDDLKQILEFRNTENLSYLELMQFHRRIKDLRYNFIFDLKEKLFSYLYEFDEKRIDKIALRMVKRMETNHIELLIKKLTELK